MQTEQISNQNVWDTDFAAAARRAAIARIPRMKVRKERDLAPGVRARDLIGTDVSAMDARSVKAYLAGHGDLRSWWWNVCSAVIGFVKQQPLEHTMADFHRAHHSVFFFWLQYKRDVHTKARSLQAAWVGGVEQRH
jgi:hypothetical protein